MKVNVRTIFIISILAICIIAITLALYFQISSKPKESSEKEDINIDTTFLTENFENIFNNQIDYQGNNVSVVKSDYAKELVYTNYTNQEKLQDFYDLNINIPHINVSNNVAEEINNQIDNLFYNKVLEILNKTNGYTVYNVTYKAYVNNNILSLIIKADLKEGQNAQRVIMKTYNYNLSSNSNLSLKEILQYRGLAESTVQIKINATIEVASENINMYKDLGYTKYLRNINDSMYKLENTNVYFLGENKALYIIYPYGNLSFTSEVDLLVI